MKKRLAYLAYGVAAGVLLAGASQGALRAAGSGANDKLAVFAEVFNKVRDNYAEKPDDEKIDQVGDRRHAGVARSAFKLF